MIGKTISHYQIVEKLGEGGMSVVYKARDLRLDRFVCIKVLRSEQLKDESRKQRFIQEARAASSLNHPNIITIHEIDQENGTDLIVMELIAGKTLQQLIPAGRLQPLLKALDRHDAKHQEAQECADYIRNNRDRMRYMAVVLAE